MLTNLQFDRTRWLASSLAGIELVERHRELLERRYRRIGFGDGQQLDALLKAAEEGEATATQRVLYVLTTKFTGFFRHRRHFDIAAEHALQAANLRGEARLWSAATATGEEAYSMALALIEAFDTDEPVAQILATDIDTQALATAQRGEYGEQSLEVLDSRSRTRFFSEAERLQLDGFLVKPVTKSMIVDTLVNVFAQAGETVTKAEGEQAASLRGVRISLVEDNEINQQIAIELLEASGAAVKIANNGREAVDLLSNSPEPPPFDVVLMDLQMPEMDGYQATAKLRADPRFGALPIIAMTAHATIEERQRCLSAGMNDHISKPIDPAMLYETVGRFFKPLTPASAPHDGDGKTAAPAAEPGQALPEIKGLDAQDGLSRVAGNRRLYLKLLRQFQEQQGTIVGQISSALGQGDSPLAERLAHTLKGVAGNIGAKAVQAAAGKVEKLIRDRAAASEEEAANRDLAAVLDPMLAGLRAVLSTQALEPPQGTTPAPAEPAESREAVAQLVRLLSEFDPGAADFIEEKKAVLRPLFPSEDWAQFEQLVQSYSFAEAQTCLEQAVKTPSLP